MDNLDTSTVSIEWRVKRTIADQLGTEQAKLKSEDRLVEDLDADSLDTIELCMALEEDFEIQIPDEACEKLHTVQQVIDYIKSREDAR